MKDPSRRGSQCACALGCLRKEGNIPQKKKGGEYYDVHSPSLFLKKKIYTTKIAGNVGEKFYSLPQVV
jgi:hypothetical protein